MKKTLLILCLVSIMVLGTAGLALAKNTRYGPPCIADDAGTETKKTLEWGTSVIQTWDSGFYTTTIITALTYGITDHLEAYVAPYVLSAVWGRDLHTGGNANLIRAYGNHGANNQTFSDIWVGAKYMFLEEVKGKAMPAMAVKYGLKIPCKSNSKYMTTGEVDHKLTYCVTKSLGKAQLDGNVAFRYYHRSDDPAVGNAFTNEWSWNTSLMYPIAPKTLAVAELTGKNEYRKIHMTSDDYITDAYLGVKYSVTKDFKGKIAVGKRITCADPDILGYLGLVYYFHL